MYSGQFRVCLRGSLSLALCLASICAGLLCLSVGCQQSPLQVAEQQAKEKAEKVREKKKQDKNIVGKTTREISEWDPDAGRKLREEGGDKVNMINRNFQALSFATHETAKIKFKQGLNLFYATEGRYPKTFEEFKEKVFDVYIVDLPMPVTTCEYQYDVENHELLVVQREE